MIRPTRILSTLAIDLINHYQGGFPLTPKPFQAVAEELGCTENEVISTLDKLLTSRWLTRFGPLFDAKVLGGGLTLAAVSAPDDQYDEIADTISSLPQVAHNYRREHELNMWFVIATETESDIYNTIKTIENETSLQVYNFPKQHEFYVGLWLRLTQDHVDTVPVEGEPGTILNYHSQPIDRELIIATQSGLPLLTDPWRYIANKTGISPSTVIARLQYMQHAGVIRRIGVVPNHYKLGLRANGMSVWNIDDEKIEQIGQCVGKLDFVSHCYQRPRQNKVWPYNLFAMVHGHDRDEVSMKVRQIELLLGNTCSKNDILYSNRILKKSGLRLVA